jgi:hypothetical protein
MIKLPRLPYGWKERPQLFERYWDLAMSQIEGNINQLLSLPAIQQALQDVNEAAINANEAAINANEAANAVEKETSLVNSYISTSSYTGDLISCTVGAVITVQTHTRVYGSPTLNPNTLVTGGTFTVVGAAPGDVVRVFYNDASRSGGAVTYTYSVDPSPPPVQTDSTHVVGTIVVPSTGTVSGNILRNPGFVDTL